MIMDKKLFLLDAYALIYRAYYAFITSPMKNSKGLNTSTIFGFISVMDEVLRKEDPSHIAVVFDPGGPTFRHEMFPPYKANREETPEDIRLAVPIIKELINAFNIAVVESEGYEADDVIGTLSAQAEKEGFRVYMMTPDKDYAQLVSENAFVFKPKRAGSEVEIWDIAFVKEKFGVESPAQVVEILALWGDAADNIPGVPGIGEKTSKKIISAYNNLESVYDHIEDFKGKQKENLINYKKQAFLSRELVTIKLDVPIQFVPENYVRKELDAEKLGVLFDDLEFRTLKSRILNQKSPEDNSSPVQGNLFSDEVTPISYEQKFDTIDTIDKNYKKLESLEVFDDFRKKAYTKKSFCFDTETTSLNPHEAELLGIALCCEKDVAYYFSYKDPESSFLLDKIKSLIEDSSLTKIGQNLKYDIRVLKKHGIHCHGKLFDTMVAHYLVQPEQRHNLNALSEQYLNYSPIKIESLIGSKGKNQKTMDKVEEGKLIEYACEDADLTWQLAEKLRVSVEENELESLATEIEMPLIYVLADMEHEGVKIDDTILNDFGIILNRELISKEKEIFRHAGTGFNISSPKQLGEILFDKLKIASDVKKTKSKQYSTNEEVLNSLTDKHEIVSHVLEYRSLKKLLSTYVEALPKLILESTGRLHTSYNQTLVATGRLSSNNPNLQNIPIREERGREVRKAFVPGNPDGLIIAADYSQIELRIMAHLSGDQNMIEAFHENQDIHTATAAKIYGVSGKDVSREMRSKAKTANFGIIYGISAFGLSQRLKIKRTEAKELIDGYFSSFPGVKSYMEASIENARETSYVKTLLGRIRYLPDIKSRNAVVRGVAERNAINAPIQGSAADIIKIAMIRIFHRMREESFKSKMILQVHDELIFDVVAKEKESLSLLIKEEMENAWKLNVPLTVDMGVGKNWLEAH